MIKEHLLQFLGLLLTALGERLLSYLLKRTERIAANSTAELISQGFKRLFKQKENGMQKVFEIPGGKVTASFSEGKAQLEIAESAGMGGGQAAGVVQVEGSAKATLSALQAIQLAEALLNAHLPAAAAAVAQPIEAFINAQIASA